MIVDLQTPGIQVDTLASRVREQWPEARCVAYGPHVAVGALQQARQAGYAIVYNRDELLALDLAGTERVDSAGLALLLEWKARAQDRNEALSLINPPEHLLRLAALGEATELLGLVGETNPEGGAP